MAIVQCKECGAKVSTKAPTCPQCGARRTVGLAKVLMWAGLVGFVVIVFSVVIAPAAQGLGASLAVSQATSAPGVALSPQPEIAPEVAPEPIQPTPEPNIQTGNTPSDPRAYMEHAAGNATASLWTYTSTVDEMSSKRLPAAQIDSNNSFSFSSPYEGDQKATLGIGKSEAGETVAVFAILQGQILCPVYKGCDILLRFDDEPAKKWGALPAADNNTTIIYLEHPDKLLAKIKTTKVLRIQALYFKEGSPVAEFDVSGFSEEKWLYGTDG